MGILRVMINVSETAASKINELLVEEQKAGGGLRVFVQGGGCSGFQYGMMIEENGQGAGDQVFEFNRSRTSEAVIGEHQGDGRRAMPRQSTPSCLAYDRRSGRAEQ